jgi:hypothetical protein
MQWVNLKSKDDTRDLRTEKGTTFGSAGLLGWTVYLDLEPLAHGYLLSA